eukprot:TRINITY_DN17870_c0_g1_i1.p1 TRINITY_DN17870_c0_g1~~TRINITY_DN17870_c0_g1_i1.p1  ORF type:complete len:319 (-),score=59.99 TRINITY_DN17870_c0_g1_i1:188-1012(-)
MSDRYTPEAYNLMTHNCNNFSDEVANLLVGRGIPDDIVGLPQEVLNSPMGALIAPMIQQLETTLRYNGVPQPPQMIRNPAANGMMSVGGGEGVRNVSLSRAPVSANQDPRIRQAAENRLAAAGGRLSAEQGAEAPRVAVASPVGGNAATAKAVNVTVSTQSLDVTKVDSNKVRGTAAGAGEASAPAEQGRAEASSPAPKKTAGSEASRSNNDGGSSAPVDPLGGARALVQEEITREFSRLMADGGLAANEAAVLAMRHVMARHGLASNSPRTRA